MKKIFIKIRSLFREIQAFSNKKFRKIFTLFDNIRKLFRISRTLSILWSVLKILISFNMLYSFPIPFLFEPVNVLVNVFRNLVDDLASIYFAIYYWFRERFFGYPLPDISIKQDRSEGKETVRTQKPKGFDELTEQEKEYIKREFYKNSKISEDLAWYQSPYVIIGGLLVISLCAGAAYYYYFIYSGPTNDGGGGNFGDTPDIELTYVREQTKNLYLGKETGRLLPHTETSLSSSSPSPAGGKYDLVSEISKKLENAQTKSRWQIAKEKFDLIFQDDAPKSKIEYVDPWNEAPKGITKEEYNTYFAEPTATVTPEVEEFVQGSSNTSISSGTSTPTSTLLRHHRLQLHQLLLLLSCGRLHQIRKHQCFLHHF